MTSSIRLFSLQRKAHPKDLIARLKVEGTAKVCIQDKKLTLITQWSYPKLDKVDLRALRYSSMTSLM